MMTSVLLTFDSHRLAVSVHTVNGVRHLSVAVTVGSPGVCVATSDATAGACQLIEHPPSPPYLWLGDTAFRLDPAAAASVAPLLNMKEDDT